MQPLHMVPISGQLASEQLCDGCELLGRCPFREPVDMVMVAMPPNDGRVCGHVWSGAVWCHAMQARGSFCNPQGKGNMKQPSGDFAAGLVRPS